MSENANLSNLLRKLIAQGASDLLLVHGTPASVRLDGEVRKINDEVLDGSAIEATVQPILTPVAAQQYRETQIADSSYRVAGLGRFRINLHRERGQAAATILTHLGPG